MKKVDLLIKGNLFADKVEGGQAFPRRNNTG
jgi:hypothetical protein